MSRADEEIPASIDVVRYYAGACRTPEGRSTGEYIEGVTSGIRREPVGVCGQITPWNYPFMMAAWKWAPAVAAGNAVVLKPSELTPSSTSRMAELLSDVLPAGVLNVVCGGAGRGCCAGRASARRNGGGDRITANRAARWRVRPRIGSHVCISNSAATRLC